jgi:phage terminase small subunit
MIDKEKLIKKIANGDSNLKRRMPFVEWLDNPEAWSKKKFFDETAEYLYQNYGITHSYNRNALGMLADQMDIYIKCNMILTNSDQLIVETNNGKTLAPNPAIGIRNNASVLILKIMKELGLTPNSHLSASKLATEDSIDDLLKGPKAA